ncbi:MAG TPA: hypothetical protein VNJ01_05620 [Bacteriovoracaceae bacterium]|nr:hypothetical protein [Bacteriovoracaceae bacterium]
MTRKEILSQVSATKHFADWGDADYMVLLNELEATSNRLTIGYALHFAYLLGYKEANQNIQRKAGIGVDWSDSCMDLGLSVLD